MPIDPQQVAKQIFQFEMFDMFSDTDIISVLKSADDLYFNDQESFISDEEYDSLRLYAWKTFPQHKYFTGVGAAVRGGKIKLPFPMGSLDQIQIGEIVAWVRKWSLVSENMFITDKLDGTSALIIYDDDGNLQIAYSRGDGIMGADITRHIQYIVPTQIRGACAIRGECIISKTNFPLAKKIAKTRGGEEYKNARNMVAGLMNASSNDVAVYQYIDFIAYEIVGDTSHSKYDMFNELTQDRFKVPYYNMVGGGDLTDDMLADYLNTRRDVVDYEIDGLVIDANDTAMRQEMNPTKDTLNPAYSIKYKVADASNLAEANVVAVHWAPSKHGYLKPRIEIEPVDLQGVTITFCTGFNAKFIEDNRIGEGAVIEITRSGDVIPFCQKVIKGTTAQMPSDDYVWSDEGVDAILKDFDQNVDVQINQMISFFSAIDAPLLKEGSIRKLYEEGYSTIESIIMMDEKELVRIIGSNGRKIYNGLKKVLTDIPLYKILGAHSMERGIGVRRMKKLQEALGKDVLIKCDQVDMISDQDGFDVITAQAVVKAIEKFQEFMFEITGYITIAAEKDTSNGPLAGQKFVFTGFRNKQLEARIEDNGGTMQSSVSKKTDYVVTTNVSATSTKLNKARDFGIAIISVDDLEDLF